MSSNTLRVFARVNPDDLSVNSTRGNTKRKSARAVRAMRDLGIEMKEAIKAQGFDATRYPWLDLEIAFCFPTLANDVDNPLKRTIDTFQGVLLALDMPWNDNKVETILLHRYTSVRTGAAPFITFWATGYAEPAAISLPTDHPALEFVA